MTINEAGLRAATARNSSDPFITLIKIEAPELVDPLRFAQNDEDITRTENTASVVYERSGFAYTPPPQGDTGNYIGQLRIDIVDRSLVQAVLQFAEKPTITLMEVLASDPEHVQQAFPPFKFFAISWDNLSMTGSLGVPDDQDEPSSSFFYNQKHAPGIYAG